MQRAQEKAGARPEQCFASLAEALDAVECDLVLATLRTEAHYAVVKQALEAGHHVVVEKPFASTIAQAKELVALAAERQRLLMVSQNYRYYPAPLLAAELIAQKALGPLSTVGIDFRYHAPTHGHAYPDMADPLLADMAIHHFDLMRLVLGDEPRRVSAVTWNPAGSPFAHDAAGIVTIEFARGTMVSYRGSWMSGAPRTPWAGEWSMDCAHGEIRWSSRDDLAPPGKSDVLTMRQYGQEAVAPKLPHAALPRPGGVAGRGHRGDRDRRVVAAFPDRRRQPQQPGPGGGVDPVGFAPGRLGRNRRGSRLEPCSGSVPANRSRRLRARSRRVRWRRHDDDGFGDAVASHMGDAGGAGACRGLAIAGAAGPGAGRHRRRRTGGDGGGHRRRRARLRRLGDASAARRRMSARRVPM